MNYPFELKLGFEDLKSRLLVPILGIPVILLLLYFGSWPFALFVTLVCILAQNEFYILSFRKKAQPHITYGLVAGVLLNIFYYFIGISHVLYILIILITLFLLLKQLFTTDDNPFWDSAITLLGIIYIPGLLGMLITTRQISHYQTAYGYYEIGKLMIAIFVTVWICDTGAYFIGKRWGKRKLFPRRSPKKTWTGAIAGYISGVLTLLIFKLSGMLDSFNYLDLFIFSLITSVFGQMGDLIESMFKRDASVKDSSHFLKGHGGVLDRFDSFFIVAPLLYIYLIIRI